MQCVHIYNKPFPHSGVGMNLKFLYQSHMSGKGIAPPGCNYTHITCWSRPVPGNQGPRSHALTHKVACLLPLLPATCSPARSPSSSL